MPNTDKEREYWNAQKHGSKTTDNENPEDKGEEQPSVERGERLDTGKTIARGGKSEGKVPGTNESTGK